MLNNDFREFVNLVEHSRSSPDDSRIDENWSEDDGNSLKPGTDTLAKVFDGMESILANECKAKTNKPHEQLLFNEDGAPIASASEDTKPQPRKKGGFTIEFSHLGADQGRAHYVREVRAIHINLDHPYIASLVRTYALESQEFQRVSIECAISEYAVALASELASKDYYLEPIDYIVDVRNTIDRVLRLSARVFSNG